MASRGAGEARQALKRPMGGARGFRALDPEVLVEEALVDVMLVEMVRCQNHREDRRLGGEQRPGGQF